VHLGDTDSRVHRKKAHHLYIQIFWDIVIPTCTYDSKHVPTLRGIRAQAPACTQTP
jgi:hypothetical protein